MWTGENKTRARERRSKTRAASLGGGKNGDDIATEANAGARRDADDR
jgi:hypothetical protein